MAETQDITRPIVDALTQLGIYCLRLNSGKVQVRGGWMKLCPEGTADIVIFPRGRMPVWVETKTKTGKLRTAQIAFADKMADLGHSYWTIRSLDEMLKLAEGLR